ncbi:hypothetical protein AeMF1_000453 [Aphanomyces euteiches]|nr:hypothetical protein AeMF1_000453 [Aphanomyces euteiches]KAH9192547.1 hypothetical protein AeNC1_005482 [Aphanomyces euteiches]
MDFSTARQYYDAIDQIRAVLNEFEDIVQEVPSFVVVGMQSVGKSAVLRRISGFPFPQDSQVCTRVPMELSMRRCRGREKLTVTIRAREKVWTDGDHEANLTAAQTEILGGKQFECQDLVRIVKQDADCPEVTLIDLPGLFFAGNDDAAPLQAMVEDLVTKRIASDMALICHVVPLNQDHKTLNTWLLVHNADPARRRTIFIFTKADKVTDKSEFQRRIGAIMEDESHEKGSVLPKCFIIHGAATTEKEELSSLAHVESWVDEMGLQESVSVGVRALNGHLESVMLAHIQENLPRLRRRLEKEEQEQREHLALIGRTPMDASMVVFGGVQDMIQATQSCFASLLPALRVKFESMATTLQEVTMEPLGNQLTADEIAAKLQTFQFSPLEYNASRQKREIRNVETPWVADFLTLAVEAREVLNKSRGLYNDAFEGSMDVLKAWMVQFDADTSQIATSFVNESFDLVLRELAASQAEATKPNFEKAMASVGLPKLRRALEATRAAALACVENLHHWNTGRCLMTANVTDFASESTPFDVEQSLVDALTPEARLMWKPVFTAVWNTRGFLSSRKKLVAEVVLNEVMRLLSDYVDKTVREVLCSCSAAMAAVSDEPGPLAKKRKRALDRENGVKSALQTIESLY